MRKAFLAIIFALSLMAFALPVSASDKVDNVFITGLNAGYYGSTGWIGENYDAGVGFGLFFGYGITEYFSMELDYYPMFMTSPSGDDVDNQDTAVWGGFANGGFGGIGIMGRLYPRKTFREADFKVVQPYLGLGATYLNFIWEYKEVPEGTDYEYDGVTNLLVDFAFGIDFYVAEWVSIGPSLGIHKPFLMGDTLQGETVESEQKTDWEGSYLWNASLGVKFQW